MEKQVLQKLIDYITDIVQRESNSWFRSELLARLGTSPSSPDAIDEIYEYCIAKIAREQAEQFYNEFNIPAIKSKLIDDFIRMEKSKRQGNFEDFSLALFQQLEAIINHLCREDKAFRNFISTNWYQPGLSRFNREIKKVETDSTSTILKYIIDDRKREDANPLPYELYTDKIDEWEIRFKARAVLYFYYFDKKLISKGEMYKKYNILNEIKLIRNLNHRGDFQYDNQKEAIERILPQKNKYYYRFMGYLEDFVTAVSGNLNPAEKDTI